LWLDDNGAKYITVNGKKAGVFKEVPIKKISSTNVELDESMGIDELDPIEIKEPMSDDEFFDIIEGAQQ